MNSTNSELIVDQSKIASMVSLMGYDVNEDGFIVDEDGNRVKSTTGEPIPISEIGYIGYENGDLKPVPDSFPKVVEYLSTRRGDADE